MDKVLYGDIVREASDIEKNEAERALKEEFAWYTPLPVASAISTHRALTYKGGATDIFVSTFPKSGTTLGTYMCHLIRSRGEEDFVDIDQVCPWTDLAYDCGQDLAAEQTSGLSVFKTHMNVGDCLRLYPRSKFVVIVRSPEKVLRSIFCFLKQKEENYPEMKEIVDENEFVHSPIWKEYNFFRGNYFTVVREALKVAKHKQVCLVFYENLVRNSRAEIQRVSKFMKKDLSLDEVEKISKQISHNEMRKDAEKFSEKFINTMQIKLGRYGHAGATVAASKITDTCKSRVNYTEETIAVLRSDWKKQVQTHSDFASYEEALTQLCH